MEFTNKIAVGNLPPDQQNSPALPYPSQVDGFPQPPTDNPIGNSPGVVIDGYQEAGTSVPTPDIADMQKLAGYEGISFDTSATAPPPDLNISTGPAPDRAELNNVSRLTEEGARDALLNFVSENCCYRAKAAKEMIFRDLSHRSVYHYSLESFCEKRETAWAFEPYNGNPLSVGYAPGPWEINVDPTSDFINSTAILEVPNTSDVRICIKCAGTGRVCCSTCCGRGNTHCSWCHGSGHRTESDGCRNGCTMCHGTGNQRCSCCNGSGNITCKTCNGRTQLRYFIRLTIIWTDHVEDHISETDLPQELIRSVTGQIAFEEQAPRVWPVEHFPEPSVNGASKNFVYKHRIAFPSERMLKQRQRVRVVPVTEVDYKWKTEEGKFHIYGFENKVNFPGYPQKCCGCSIL